MKVEVHQTTQGSRFDKALQRARQCTYKKKTQNGRKRFLNLYKKWILYSLLSVSLAGALSLQDFSPSQFHAGALWGWDQVGWDQVVQWGWDQGCYHTEGSALIHDCDVPASLRGP